jgi:hypothetical protein
MDFVGKKMTVSPLFIALTVWFIPCLGWCTASISVPMVSSAWSTKGEASFVPTQENRGAALILRHGTAVLENTDFSNGLIEFDVKFDGGIAGMTFRQHGNTGDVLYFRPSENCASSDDCVQYMPRSHGIFEWDLYNQYQSPAPIKLGVWNHVKVILAGKRMSLFVNGDSTPVMTVEHMVGDFSSGTIELHGPASYSNLTLTPDKVLVSALPDAQAKNTLSDYFIRGWQASIPFAMPSHQDRSLDEATGDAPGYSSMPSASASWQRIETDSDGLVNLSRTFGDKQTGSSIIATWLKTEVDSSRNQIKHVRIGWIREIWVFDNGKLIFANKNLYGIPSASKTPDGRLSLDNGAFDLPLRRGKNEVVVLIDDNMGGGAQHFGWGMQMKLTDSEGVNFPNELSPSTGKP